MGHEFHKLVRPCVHGFSGGEIPLDVALKPLLSKKVTGSVAIIGERGSGKSCAISYLSCLATEYSHIQFHDNPELHEVRIAAQTRLVIYTRDDPPMGGENDLDLAGFALSAWGVDQWLEYLLMMHPAACRSVMERIKSSWDFAEIGSAPLLATIILDQFAADEKLADIDVAIRRFIRDNFQPESVLADARTFGLNDMFEGDPGKVADRLVAPNIPRRIFQSLQNSSVRRILAVDRVMDDLLRRRIPKYFVQQFQPTFIEAVGRAIASDAPARDQLLQIVNVKRRWRLHPTAAGILAASGTGWMPDGQSLPNLIAAHLRGVNWKGARLSGAILNQSNLSLANLQDSFLDRVQASGAVLVRADMHGALLRDSNFRAADFTGANLSYTRAERVDFSKARLSGARLEGSLLAGADFTDSDLSGAGFLRANLLGAEFNNAVLRDTDFTSACLQEVALIGQDLRSAVLAATDFSQAMLMGSNLEYQTCADASFRKANLSNALLTGSEFPKADFRGASLSGAGLADIDWEQADLRNADFTGASFHAGSSRSGLVGSPIACEGSRTGFYTDEYYEQDFMAPEEIRKANLRSADLRGAIVHETDFYLVDVRGAICDADQESHFRKCGAIVESRAV